MSKTRTTVRTVATALAALAGVAFVVAQPASAGSDKPTRPSYLMIRGSGTWTPEPGGGAAGANVDVWLPHAAVPTAATASATLHPLDGSFPGSEACEAASAVITTSGPRRLSVTMEAQGTVCGGFTEDPATFPAQNFVGRYIVTDGAGRFRGDDGFMQVQLYDDGGAYLFATDS